MSNIPETGRTQRVTIRLVILQILVVSLLCTLGGRLWYLQIRNGQQYTAEAASNHVQEVVTPAVRGSILDERGVPLADNETRLVVTVSRTDMLKMKDGGKAVLGRLAAVLGMSEKDVADKVRLCDAKTPKPCWNGSPYQPIPITDKATTQQALQIMERREDFPGIAAQPTAVRRYDSPDHANAAQVLGYLSPVTDDEIKASMKNGQPTLQRSDQVGRSGLEHTYDAELRGKAGITRYEVDNRGRVIGNAGDTPPQPGNSLVTSIDSRVQAVTEKELAQAMEDARHVWDKNTNTWYKADSGAAIVMDVHTGRIIAMANAPTYDPNVWVGGISAKDYKALTGDGSDYPLLNRAIQGLSAPGSTFKVIPTTAAINAGYAADGHYPCTSSMTIGGQTFGNFESESAGDISLGKALEISCDTVFYGLAYDQWLKDGGNNPKHPKDWFYTTARQFGLGEKTGVDLPGEAKGRIPDRTWKQRFWEANKTAWCAQAKSDKDDYATRIAREDCTDGNRLRAGDSVNYSIGQGDTLVTPLQMARIYSALSNGGTLYQPTIGKAIVSADGKHVQEIKPKATGKLPDSQETLHYIDDALAGTITSGTAAWKYQGWPQDKITLHAKTGTAEVYGKQTTSWLATYSKDYAIVMTIAQGGTGSGGSGAAVRAIYEALYGVDGGNIDPKKGLLPQPRETLPKFGPDGQAQQVAYVPARAFAYPPEPAGPAAPGYAPAALAPDRNEKLLLGRRYHV
ncbi:MULTISPECIES: penicillin-binding protein 2 [Streptomycetaceae]|uniref:Penicillin-binding protein n=1 Tax=Streptantibioticus cattleyicolor (strain ATCC 35852 / DSM 46488 / JCM 4925 / NBRC 14057 / NRRL 8057) TaxID=1003195 RepID=F8JR12_STREN|nr:MULTISPECIES: penicillin-binding protein 2 [Streptomycetaceae]AEW94095.1 penicillin-binding protein [Streptantibioticus cattleyicolor NRRL 8057 = DSM 46488]MYS58763.1 penicillin-binding protein 2 [Streptomyces sp. SID5468]CCB74450.1 putative penicillin-binding protein [Streptantibioticus cattleyicolor NRRL 8057 = DSM 46488]